jgi:hypothetical protein
VRGHSGKACVDLALFANADPIHGRTHVVVNTAPRHAAEHTKRMRMRVEQHLVRRQRIGPDEEGAAEAKFESKREPIPTFPGFAVSADIAASFWAERWTNGRVLIRGA